MTLLRRLSASLLTALTLSLAGGTAAAGAPPDRAYLRLAHLSPDTPTVDVYLASVGRPDQWFVVPGVGYGSVSDYRALPVDSYTVAMRAAGAPAESPPVISTVLTAQAGSAYTVAGTGLYDELGLTVLQDELGMPAAGQARIRVINAAATAREVDLSIEGGPTIAENVGFAETTGYRTVPTGSWTVQAATPSAVEPTSLPIDVTANAVYTVLLLDKGGRLSTELHLDSAGAAAVPVGGVQTGLGGTADRPAGEPPADWMLLTAGVAATIVAAASAAMLARRCDPTRARQ